MSLRNFPYEARDLEMHLTLVDTWSAVPGHPGVKLVPSAVSLEVGGCL